METIEFSYKGEQAFFTIIYLGLNARPALMVECDHPAFKKAILGLHSVRCGSVIGLCDDHLQDDSDFFTAMKKAFIKSKS